MDVMWRDIRFALRSMWRAPGFTVVAVGTLALGIGANTAIFSVVDGVLLRELPYDQPDDLVTVWLDTSRRDGSPREWLSYPDFSDLRSEPSLFEEMGAWREWSPTLSSLGAPTVLTAALVTEGMFGGVLRVQPVLGRGFVPEEDRPDGERVLMLSHNSWQERFGGDPSVLGRAVTLSEEPYTIVGVMPAGFEPPFLPRAEVWAPLRFDESECGRGCYSLRTVARLAPGVSLQAARRRGNGLAARLEEAFPDFNGKVGVAVFGLRDDLVRPVARGLWVLLGAVGFVLLIACTNVANLILARGTAREGEFAVRVAIGAARGPIVMQLLTESVILAASGGLLGLLVAAWSTEGLLAMGPPLALPGLESIGVDTRALLFTAAITLGTGILFGLFPALRASATHVYAGIQGRGRRGRKVASGVRGGLVVSQVALALVLLVGAGLLIRSFQRLNSADLGFNPQGVLAMRVTLPEGRFARSSDQVRYYDALLEELRAIPGVNAVGGTSSLPLAGNDKSADFRIQGQALRAPTEVNSAWVRQVTARYFDTMGQRLLEGRPFENGDDARSDAVIIVNESMARRYFDYPRRTPMGARVALDTAAEPTWATIVGIARDTRHFGIRDAARAAIYLPYRQVAASSMTLVLRTDGDPLEVAADARQAVTEVDEALAASVITPIEALVGSTISTDRFVTRLLTAFALLSLLIAAVGLYGVVSYGVSRRLREMGIRLALGAGGGDIRRLVVSGGLWLTVAGVGLGVAGALMMAGALQPLLYEAPVTDAATMSAMVIVLAGVALFASWIPARRAGDTDPVSVLREE